MSNIVINPLSGILEFNTGTVGLSTFDDTFNNSSRLSFVNSGELNLKSFNATNLDRFTIDGYNGRLFTVNDVTTGTVFSVNDVAGLPLVEVYTDTTNDFVYLGPYNTNTLAVSGTRVGIGTNSPASILHVSGDITLQPSTLVNPTLNGCLMVQATSNTQLTFKLRGTDGTLRSGSLTLS